MVLKNTPDEPLEVVTICSVQMEFSGIPLYQQPGGFSEHAGVYGGVLKRGEQFDAKDGYFRVNSFRVSDVPELAYFREIQGAGIEAVFTGVLIAFLPAALSFYFVIVHSSKIAQALRVSKAILSYFY